MIKRYAHCVQAGRGNEMVAIDNGSLNHLQAAIKHQTDNQPRTCICMLHVHTASMPWH